MGRFKIKGYLLSERDSLRLRNPAAGDLWEAGGQIVLKIHRVGGEYVRYCTDTDERGNLLLYPAEHLIQVAPLTKLHQVLVSCVPSYDAAVVCHRPINICPEIAK